MSTPLVAGAAALVRQHYVQREEIQPSAALVKATLIDGATDLAPGQYGAGTGSIVVVRNFNTSTFLRFYAIGVINGNASVYVVNTSSPAPQLKYTFNGTAVTCP